MNAESDRLIIMPVEAEEAGQHATAEEVEKALNALSPEDHAKLIMFAKSFCRRRHLSTSVMEPEDLLSEAIAKTLQLIRKWNKRVTLLKHLDRAMESISGHVVSERERIDSFPEGLEPGKEQRGPIPTADGPDETLMSKEEVAAKLRKIFGNDDEAARVFALRLEGFQATDIKAECGLSQIRYDAVAKRIRRKLNLYSNQKL